MGKFEIFDNGIINIIEEFGIPQNISPNTTDIVWTQEIILSEQKIEDDIFDIDIFIELSIRLKESDTLILKLKTLSKFFKKMKQTEHINNDLSKVYEEAITILAIKAISHNNGVFAALRNKYNMQNFKYVPLHRKYIRSQIMDFIFRSLNDRFYS